MYGRVPDVAAEQAALRRVATLVAEGPSPEEIFGCVAEETGKVVDASITNLVRFDPDGTEMTMAGWSRAGNHMPTGGRFPLDGECIDVLVLRTGAPGRIDSYDGLPGTIAAEVRSRGITAEVGAPVFVHGRLWGALIASTTRPGPAPEGSEERVASFAELVGTAIANAQDRSELLASRSRIVTAADAERRRIERNLHDGTQQRLVSLALDLRIAQAELPESADARAGIDAVIEGLNEVLEDVREISRGLHPAVLSQAGLEPALRALARRAAVPVELTVDVGARLDPSVEIAAYYAVSEALANTAKHARATSATVSVALENGVLRAAIRDDGTGGATLGGHGLTGLVDRVEALGGRLELHSPPGEGTELDVRLPAPASSS